MDILKNRAFLLALLIVAGLAFEFWTGSRYPQLDQKAMMAGSAGLEPLGFNTVFVVADDDALYMKILKGTVNWGKTNQRGMTFGILFAAALLTMISLFKRKSFEGSWSNSALGVLIGTPLGVCVNCAAPIAKGLHSSGLRVETTLAAMISSPTLNVIVLAMVFSLFPLHIAALKVIGTLVFLLVVLPLLSKYFFKTEVTASAQRAIAGAGPSDPKFMALDAPVPDDDEINTWPKAFIWLLKAFPRNLWFIVKTTLPLMVLAGFLGALAVNIIPLDTLADLFPRGSVAMALAGLAVAALIGVFMPVPITFDVIIVSVLMAAGMPVMYGMTLLFTLGIYSVYSYMIVATTISRKVAVTLWVAIAGVGIVVGVVAHEYDQWLTQKQNAFMIKTWSELDNVIEYAPPQAPDGAPQSQMLAQLAGNRLSANRVMASVADGISVDAIDFAAATPSGDMPLFTRLEGSDVGVAQPNQFSILKWSQPWSEFGGVASGDVHNDGWPDLVVSSQSGAYLYANIGGTFEQQELDIAGLHDEFVANVALADIDGDGWLDLVYSTYRNGTYLVYNDKGVFSDANRIRLPNWEGAWVSAAIAFGDLNEDGKLDIVLGNWTLGSALSRQALGRESSRNVMLINRGDSFEMSELAGPDGETLTVLLSDWNSDGHLDAIVGNDFGVPDMYYLGDGTGDLRLVTTDDEIIPVSALLTMSVTSADINNDLRPEIYIGNVSGTDHSVMKRIPDMCEDVEGFSGYEECLDIRAKQQVMNSSLSQKDPIMCSALNDVDLVDQCLGMHLSLDSWWKRDPQFCEMLGGKFPALSAVCEEYWRVEEQPVKGAFMAMIPQGSRRANVLLVPGEDGKFTDQALEYDLREAGWVWNSKFADLDHDEWQDIYIVNGYFNENTQPARESNHLFLNNKGAKFTDATEAAGMQLFAESTTYTYIDFDNDGDLDIIGREVLGPVWVYRNNTPNRNSIMFELNDERGNRDGIGARVEVSYAGRAQMREMMASGGFASFDAPVVHFGLGDVSAVDGVSVTWPDGETTRLTSDFAAGRRYVINRK